MSVLVDGVTDVLGEIGFEFGGGDWNTIEKEYQIQAVFVVLRVVNLADDSEPVGLKAGEDVRVESEGGFELRQRQGLAESQDLHAMPKNVECSALLDLIPDSCEESFSGAGSVIFSQRFPGFRLRGVDPGQEVRREESHRSVVVGVGIVIVQPASGSERVADVGFKLVFVVERQGVEMKAEG